jgi:hypothetical protein
MSSNTGISQSFGSQFDCEGGLAPFYSQHEPGEYWCDQSPDPNESSQS